MELIITGKDFELSESLKAYVEKKVERLRHYRSDIIQIKFELDVDKHHKKGEKFRAEGWVIAPGQQAAAGAKASDLHASIDLVVDKLGRQLTREKERRVGRKRH